MLSVRGVLRPTLRAFEGIPPVRFRASWVAVLLVALALVGLGLAVLGGFSKPSESTAPPVPPVDGLPIPRGDLPIIGDPIRDLTVWYSNRVSDATGAGLQNLRGHFLSPLDPLADSAVKDLYGKMLVITIPLLTFGGLALGYLIMISRTSGESAYTARSVTPRFVMGATLAILGIFLVSVLAQFVTATDMAMVGVSIPGNAVGGPDGWPATGGVFQVLQSGGFDPHVAEGPDNWNDGAWLSAGLLAAVLLTFVQMINGVLGALERLLVLIGPICLAAYALPATERVTNMWLKFLSAILVVRFAWTIAFILFSLEALPHIGPSGNPPTVGDMNALLGLATGAAALMLGLPFILLPLALSGSGALKPSR
jgi:hypothetical protein